MSNFIRSRWLYPFVQGESSQSVKLSLAITGSENCFIWKRKFDVHCFSPCKSQSKLHILRWLTLYKRVGVVCFSTYLVKKSPLKSNKSTSKPWIPIKKNVTTSELFDIFFHVESYTNPNEIYSKTVLTQH